MPMNWRRCDSNASSIDRDKAKIPMNFDYTETQGQIRAAVKELCKGFGPEYWRQCAQDGAYPEAFVDAMAGLKAVAEGSPGGVSGRRRSSKPATWRART